MRLLIAAAVGLAVTAPAYAASPVPVDLLPSAMLTNYKAEEVEDENNKYDLWCYIDKIKAYRRKDCRENGFSDSWMHLDGWEFEGHEWHCVAKQIWRITKGRTYRLDLRCSGLAVFYEERVVLSLSADKKTLYVKREWTSKDRDEQPGSED